MVFAHYPPPEIDNLVVELWDKHMRPDWRDGAESPEEVLARRRAAQHEEGGVAEFRTRVDAEAQLADGEPDYLVIGRQVPIWKGRWRLLPEELEKADEEDGST
jgi:hypothetical protein